MAKKKTSPPSDRPRFVVPKVALDRAIRTANSVAKANTTMPVLGHIHLVSKGDTLTVQATDLNVSVTSRVKVTHTGAAIDVALPAKEAKSMVASLADGDVTITDIERGWIHVACGNAEFRLAVLAGKDFPKCHEMPEATDEVDAGAIRSLIERTSYSVCADETRFHLNGCLFEADGAVAHMTSTDGHRLSRARASLANLKTPPAGVIVSRATLAVLQHLLDGAETCRIAVVHPIMHVACGDTRVGAKLIEAQFPPYDQVIPKGRTDAIVVPRESLAASIRRVQLMSSETRGLKLSHDAGFLSLHSEAIERGDASDDVEAVVEGSPVRAVGLAPRYLAEAVAAMPGDKVRLMLAPASQDGADIAPVVVMPEAGDDVVAVIMPMRI